MEIRLFKRGFSYGVDGDGNRLVFHLQGCNLHCPWCANPESLPLTGALMVHKDRLLNEVCPKGAIADGVLDRSRCADCAARECITRCRNQGVTCPMTVEDTAALAAEAARSAMLFFDGGGITVTGGEPTVQWDACRELLSACHARGIHTAMETNATHPRLPELFPLVDQLIMDCKHYDNEKLKRVTGVGCEGVFRNLAAAFAHHNNVLVRIPLIGGFNAQREDAAGFLERLLPLGAAKARFELLRYHEYGKVKWEECGMQYEMCGGDVSEETRVWFEQAFREAGLQVIRT